MKIVRYFFYLLIVAVLLALAAVNSQVVTLRYYWGEWVLPLSLLLFFVLFLGCFLGLLLSLGPLLKLRKECGQWRHQAKIAEKS